MIISNVISLQYHILKTETCRIRFKKDTANAPYTFKKSTKSLNFLVSYFVICHKRKSRFVVANETKPGDCYAQICNNCPTV